MLDMTDLMDMLAAYSIIVLILSIVVIAGMWKIFEKAGKPGWAAIIPIYNTWVLFEITWGNGVYMLLMFAAIIPLIGTIVALVVSVMTMNKLAKVFGKDIVYTLGLIFLPVVFIPMLGFGKDEYNGELVKTTPTAAQPVAQPTVETPTQTPEQPVAQSTEETPVQATDSVVAVTDPTPVGTPAVEAPTVAEQPTSTVIETPVSEPTVTEAEQSTETTNNNNYL